MPESQGNPGTTGPLGSEEGAGAADPTSRDGDTAAAELAALKEQNAAWRMARNY